MGFDSNKAKIFEKTGDYPQGISYVKLDPADVGVLIGHLLDLQKERSTFLYAMRLLSQ